METKFNINCPHTFKDYDIELYCGINQYIITNLGVRKYKYGKTNKYYNYGKIRLFGSN